MVGPNPYYRPPGWAPRPPPRARWWIIGVAIAFVAVAAVVLVLFLLSSAPSPGHPAYPYRVGYFGGFFFLFFLLIVAFFIVRVVLWSTRASRSYGRYGGGAPPGYGPDRPAMVARLRYARGEITREQYDQIMDGLGRSPPPS
ncbi:MAG: hypothetical protein L3J91_03435 [Thermoplasmata archaeon]|nr:hypothetical protein [Thermoplasmata archaeon]